MTESYSYLDGEYKYYISTWFFFLRGIFWIGAKPITHEDDIYPPSLKCELWHMDEFTVGFFNMVHPVRIKFTTH